jgi:hypothetical protein
VQRLEAAQRGDGLMESSGRFVGIVLAISTLAAALFVAVQAWYARVQFVETERTRLLEKKLDICFQNFDAAVAVDGALRALSPGFGVNEVWPPKVEVMDAPKLVAIQDEVVPVLNGFQSSLAKASILGPLDRFRTYLSDQVEGLSAELLNLSPAQLDDATGQAEIDEVLHRLSEFFGAQYSVFEGCRLVARGEG